MTTPNEFDEWRAENQARKDWSASLTDKQEREYARHLVEEMADQSRKQVDFQRRKR